MTDSANWAPSFAAFLDKSYLQVFAFQFAQGKQLALVTLSSPSG